MEFDLKQLAQFLLRAKKQTYAGEGAEVSAQRPGFKESEFIEGDFKYRDSYAGFFQAPGQEIVRFKGKPIWAMAYSGGMEQEYHNDFEFSLQTFKFLRKCLLRVEETKPFRGPDYFQEAEFEYFSQIQGDINSFRGRERILYQGKEVFSQHYIGGLIVDKE